MRCVLFAIVFIAASAGQSWANNFDILVGKQILDSCQSSEPAAISGCRNYVSGVTMTIMMIQAQTFVCHFIPPDNWTEEQAIGVVLDYLKAHPEEQAMPGPKNIMDAMVAKYPCPK